MIKMTRISADEVGLLRELAIKTFTETFGHDNTQEQLEDFFNEAYSIEVLSAEIASQASDQYFVYVNERLAGYLKVNWGADQTEQELDDAFEIQRIYVLKEFQGTGLGKLMFEFALEMAEQKEFTWAWLGVWEHNTKAQHFYAKYGFEKFAEHQFVVSEGKIDTDWLLKKRLK